MVPKSVFIEKMKLERWVWLSGCMALFYETGANCEEGKHKKLFDKTYMSRI